VFDYRELPSYDRSKCANAWQKSAERFFDPKLQASHNSLYWQFFNSYITQDVGPARNDSPVTILEADLSVSVESLTQLLHHVRPAEEASSRFATISSIIGDCRSHWRQSCKAIESPSTGSDGFAKEAPTSEALRFHLRTVRCYGISLTMGLVMNTIVRMYFPNQDNALVQTSLSFSRELVSLAKQATRFKPLGATFMAPFLNTVWAVGDRHSRTQMTPVLRMNQIDFQVERAMILSKKLNGLLDSLQTRILAKSPAAPSSSYPPQLAPAHCDTLLRKKQRPADQALEYHIPGAWFGCS
jgi:hypothetical protein